MHPGGQRGPEDGGALTEHGGVASKADGRRVAIHRLKGEVGVQLLLEHLEQVISQRRVRYLHPRLAVGLGVGAGLGVGLGEESGTCTRAASSATSLGSPTRTWLGLG